MAAECRLLASLGSRICCCSWLEAAWSWHSKGTSFSSLASFDFQRQMLLLFAHLPIDRDIPSRHAPAWCRLLACERSCDVCVRDCLLAWACASNKCAPARLMRRGYSLDSTALSLAACVARMLGDPLPPLDEPTRPPARRFLRVIDQARFGRPPVLV